MTEEKKGKLVLPALRAHLGDRIYYISFLKMKDIIERIDRAQLFYSSKVLKDLLQRQLLKGRAKDIGHYLVSQPQRFFNSLVIGTYGGDPKWEEISIEENVPSEIKLPSDIEGTMGFLIFEGSEKLFAIDGQHRVEGIRFVLNDNPTLNNEEISVIILKGVIGDDRTLDPEGFERTRRLFTTLNRYAKPVNKKDIIALDEDDAVAIITRQLIEEYPLFKGDKISIKGSTNIPITDKNSFTSINALYDCLDIFFRKGSKRSWSNFKKFYPGNEKISELYNKSVNLWNLYCDSFSSLKELRDSSEPDIALKYRNIDGGDILFRPIGLLITIKVIRHLMDFNNLKIEEAIEQISKIPRNLSVEPWTYLIWNPLNKKMITTTRNQKVAEKLIFNALNGDLNKLKSNEDSLTTELSAILKTDKEIKLPHY